jgi:hypothetical protein
MDHEQSASLGERVEELLELQQGLFERLDALGRRQAELIEGDDSVGLLELLAQRQRLIDGITEVNGSLEPFRGRWSAVVNSLPEPERARVNRRIDTLAELAARIATRDDADRAALEKRRDAVASEMGQIGRGRGAVAAYAGGRAPSIPKFQDREA